MDINSLKNLFKQQRGIQRMNKKYEEEFKKFVADKTEEFKKFQQFINQQQQFQNQNQQQLDETLQKNIKNLISDDNQKKAEITIKQEKEKKIEIPKNIGKTNFIKKTTKNGKTVYQYEKELNTSNQFKHKIAIINNIPEVQFECEFDESIHKDYHAIIDRNLERIRDELIQIQKKSNLPFKIQVKYTFQMVERLSDGRMQFSSFNNKTDFVPIRDVQNDLSNTLMSFDQHIDNSIQNLLNSQLNFVKYLRVTVAAIQYQQRAAGSFIKLEGLLANKSCCKNIQNKDNLCSIYCFLYIYYTKVMNKTFKDYHRPKNYNFKIEGEFLNIISINQDKVDKKIKIGNVKFPCNLEDLKKIAKGFNFTFSLFEYQSVIENDKEKIIVRVVENQKSDDKKPHIDLMLNKKEEENEINQHLMVIKSFNRLMRDSTSKSKKYYCKNCLNYFSQQEKLTIHEKYCYEKENASVDEYPEKGTKIKFQKHYKKMEIPIVLLCDFESTLEKPKDEEEFTEEEEIENIIYKSKTKKLAQHKIVSFGIQIYDKYNLLTDHYYEYVKQNENDNVMDKFLKYIELISKLVNNLIQKTNIPYKWTEELKNLKQNAKTCYLCNQPFTEKNYAVVDHDHFTGEVRGIAHNNCNLHYHLFKSKIPVIFHNLKGYDSHLIIKQIGEYMKNQKENEKQKISCIANNQEKFMSIDWNLVRFIDSFQFMASSLNQLSNNLSIDKKVYTMKYLQERFSNKLNQEEIEGILNKGLFPYSWFDSIEKLKYKEFPPEEAFYDDLNDKNVNIEEYNQSKELYKKLGFKSFKDWLLLYQTLDIKLLTDVWIDFKNMTLKNYGLDPSHYFTSPGLAWDAMLKITGVELELISDPDMYLMFEKQQRGGISTTGNIRYTKANNIGCEYYDESIPYSQLLYFDANNLYGHAMIQKLPTGNFKWIKQEDFEKYSSDFIICYIEGTIGYLYEVDLIYPHYLHDKHDAYPLAPEQKNIKYEELSQYNKNLISQLKERNSIKINMNNKNRKLTPNLSNKVRYVCNINNLQLYLQQGLILDKIHRIIQFDQSEFMKPYIELNTSLRQKSTNESDKNYYKLMNNSVFGKTCENVRNRQNYELVFTEKRMQKIVNSRYFKNYLKISNDLALVQKYQKTVKLDKPSYAGMQILDLSKIVMYKYYYEHITKEFEKVDLIMTDTDSLFMKIECSKEYDVYDSMIKNNDLYDFSNVSKGLLNDKIVKYCEQNNLDVNEFKNKNKAVVGKMKNEVPNAEIIEAVSLKAKCYGYKTSENKESKKNKGIKTNVVKNVLTLNDYKDCVFNNSVKNIQQKTIRSYNHEIFTIIQEKVGLQPFNDKKYVLDDGITTLSYGNYRIQQQN